MPHYRVLRCNEDRTVSEHLNIEAPNAATAAVQVCGEPLRISGPRNLFRAYVMAMDNPGMFAFFYAPPGSTGTFGQRLL